MCTFAGRRTQMLPDLISWLQATRVQNGKTNFPEGRSVNSVVLVSQAWGSPLMVSSQMRLRMAHFHAPGAAASI